MAEEKEIEEKKEKVKKWFQDYDNLVLFAILAFAFIIRMYYFLLTKSQPLWWDEAAYGSLAKNLLYHLWDSTSLISTEQFIRPPLFYIPWYLLIKAGFGEAAVRFILEFIPSILSVFFVYLIGKEMYSKKAGLIAAFIFSVLWIHLFYTLRLLVHMPELAFLFLSIYYFIKSTKSEFNYKYFVISFFLLSIATLVRYTNGMVFFLYAVYFLIDKAREIKKPKFWLFFLISISPLLIFFLINYILTGNIFPALFGNYLQPVGAKQGIVLPFAFSFLNYIPSYLTASGNIFSLSTFFFIFFIIGLGTALFELAIGYNFITKNKKLQNHLFLILLLLVICSFFIFFLKGGEDRYLFPASISLVAFSALGIIIFYDLIKKYNKYLAIFIILGILLFSAYSQLKFADSLIKQKKDSFLQIRQGFEWIKDNTDKNALLSGSGIDPYSIYYSERKFIPLPENKSQVDGINPDYIIVHAFTPQSDYINEYLEENQDRWQPVNVFFLDSQKQQPVLVIYKNINKGI